MKHRFLFFLYYLPPSPGTASKRNLQISKAIAAHADKAIVYTAEYPDKPKLQVQSMEIHTLNIWDYRTLLRRTTKDGYLPEQQKRIWWKQWLIRGINSFPFNILIGEGGLNYYWSLVRQGQQAIQKENITHLYSSYRPFADHYAAYKLKKQFPHLFWIADFRDLVIYPGHNQIYLPKAHDRLFKKIFSRADLVTTVSEGLAVRLKSWNDRVIVLRNGISDEILPVSPVLSKYFTITYSGSMVLDTRNARPLFDAINELSKESRIHIEDIRIVYAGKDGDYWTNLGKAFQWPFLVHDLKVVPGSEAQKLQNNSCLNILLTQSSKDLQGILTGKLIEYFQAGSPVLGIVRNQDDPELNRLLSELNIGKSFSDRDADLPVIKEFIFNEYNIWKETGMNRKPVDMEVLKLKYSTTETMRIFFQRIGLDRSKTKDVLVEER